MGILSAYVDPTGEKSTSEVNAENISQIIDELNRSSDQLDSLANQLSISTPGHVTLPISGSNSSQQTTVSLGSTAPFAFIAYMVRSDAPSNYYLVPYFLAQGAPASTMAMLAYAQLTSGSTPQLLFDVEVASGYAPPASVTFYYYILNQPANPGT